MAASDNSQKPCRLFIADRTTKKLFLVDTGADLCVFPRFWSRDSLKKTAYQLAAANGSPIATYGFKALTLDLGLRRAFQWNFVIADVAKSGPTS